MGMTDQTWLNGYEQCLRDMKEHPNTSQTWLNGYEQCLRDMRVLLKDKIAKEMGVEL